MWIDHANPGANMGPRRMPGYRPALRWQLVLAACVALVGLAALSVRIPVAEAAAHTPSGGRPPGGNFADPVVREVDIAEPAVVRIATRLQFTVSIQLCTRSVTLPQGGGSYRVEGTGSGAFISANGDILTADHVVDVPDFVLATYADQDIADVLNNASAFDPGCHYSVVVTPDLVDQALGSQITFNVHLLNHSSVVYRSTDYSGPLTVSDVKDAPSERATIVAHSAFEQNDLALVHIDATDTPSIQLDNSTTVAAEDHLTVIGFPGNGDLRNDRGQIKNPDNFLTPSVNDVLVSAIKTFDNGSQLIQVGGNVEQGDSGGPVLDSAGHIVGVVSFGGPYRGSTAFLRTSNNALDMIGSNTISMTPGAFQRHWAQAFADYAATAPGHWHKAAREMAALASSYPEFKALTPYLTYAQQAATSEVVPDSNGQTVDPLVLTVAGAGVLVLLLAGGGVLWWLLARRRARARAAATAVGPYGGYGMANVPTGQPAYAGGAPMGYPPGYGPFPGYGAPAIYGPPPGYHPVGGFGSLPSDPAGNGSSPYPGSALAGAPARSGYAYQGGTGVAPSPSGHVADFTAQGGLEPSVPVDTGVCLNGHTLPPGANMCPHCGAPRRYTA